MSGWEGFAAEVQDFVADIRDGCQEGNSGSFLRLADGQRYGAHIQIIAPNAIEQVEMEASVSLGEENPILIDALDPSCPLGVDDWIVYPADGTEAADGYKVVSVQPKPVAGVVVKLIAVAAQAPVRK